MRRSALLTIAGCFALLDCATATPVASTSATDASPAPAAQPAPDQSLLSRAEIDAANLPDGYELVNRLRRPWLRRDATNGGEVSVYVDERPLGSVDKLRDVPAVEIAEMRYYGHLDAARRWGDVPGAVILVTRKH